jgi:hypothetical protein
MEMRNFHRRRGHMIKYILYPGVVISRTDGQKYYISASRLAELYRVSMDECVVYDDVWCLGIRNKHKLIKLFPRYDGHYCLPGERNEKTKTIY